MDNYRQICQFCGLDVAAKTLELSIVRRFLIVVVQTAFADGNDFLWFSESDEFFDARFMVVILGTRMNAGGEPNVFMCIGEI